MEYFSFRAACLSWAFRAQPSIETAPTTGFSMERCVPRTKAKTRTKPLHIFSAFCVLGSQLKSSCQSASAWVHLARAPHPKAAQGLSPHIQCKPDCGKIITSLCWLFFFWLQSDTLPQPQLNHAKDSCCQPIPALPLVSGPRPHSLRARCPSLPCWGKGTSLHILPNLSPQHKLNTSTGRVSRSIPWMHLKWSRLGSTYIRLHPTFLGAMQPLVRNCCGSCLWHQLGGTQPRLWGGSYLEHRESCVGLPGQALQQGRTFGQVQGDVAGQDPI